MPGRTLFTVLALLVALSLCAVAGAAGLHGNPANQRQLVRKPIEAPRYEGTRCAR